MTGFDLDGNVQSVTRTDSGSQTIVSYIYGTTSNTVSYGQVLSVTDGLSGVQDSMTYQTSGGGLGQVSQVTESGGPNPSYSVSYAYNYAGDRWQTTYTTVNGTKTWEYDDYMAVGPIFSSKRVFQTLTLLSSGAPSAEQMQYAYDSSGALKQAAFAQTPASGFTPSSGQPWYDSTHLASIPVPILGTRIPLRRGLRCARHPAAPGRTIYTTLRGGY